MKVGMAPQEVLVDRVGWAEGGRTMFPTRGRGDESAGRDSREEIIQAVAAVEGFGGDERCHCER